MARDGGAAPRWACASRSTTSAPATRRSATSSASRSNQLKVDRTFVRDLPHNGDDVAITRAVIAMAHSLRMSVVAEGVEHQDQFDAAARRGLRRVPGLLLPPAAGGGRALALPRRRARQPLGDRTSPVSFSDVTR